MSLTEDGRSRDHCLPNSSPSEPAAQAADPRVVQALEEYWEAVEAGQPPDLQPFLARHAEIAQPLAECLEGLAWVDAVAGQLPLPVPSHSGPLGLLVGDVQMGIPLGDFHLLREVGRGGMGVVYEAEQISLGRRVALKVLPFVAGLDARQLQRFQTECQAAARLHQSHIVPIHAVGCDRGTHYYAMQFIDGHTLAEVIAELRAAAEERRTKEEGGTTEQAQRTKETSAGPGGPTRDLVSSFTLRPSAFFRTAAGWGIQAAEALDYAHRQDVIHRDIKPANLLVDGQGNLWVTDFGLARLLGESGLTLTGDLVGTLRYMSPEQALGQRVDHSADIYSLGVTLYELMTLEPAVPGTDRQEVLRRLDREEPRRPRLLNRALPPELETILCKAMSREPTERYATAKDLADDLRRFLEDLPIRACRPSFRQVMAKWARRHRGLVVTVVVAILVGLLLGIVGLVLSNARIRQKNAQAEAARQRAERNVALAMRTLDRLYVRAVEQHSLRDPRRAQEDHDLLTLALGFYQEVARENNADPETRKAVALACLRIGGIQALLGREGPAREAYERGLAASADLSAECPGDYELRVKAGYGRHMLAGLLMRMGDGAAAAEQYQRNLELGKALADEFPAVPQARYDLALSHIGLARFLATRGTLRRAEDHYRQAVALGERLVAEFPTDAGYRTILAVAHGNLSDLLRQTGRPAEAETSSRRTLDLYAQLAVENPRVPGYRVSEANACLYLGALLAHRDPGAARVLYQRALDLQVRLVTDCPAVPEYRFQQACIQSMLGGLLAEGGARTEAAEHLRQARELTEKLAADFPGMPDYRGVLVQIQENLGRLARQGAANEAAQQHFGRALELSQRLAADFPRVPRYAEELARSHQNLSELLEDVGDWEQADIHDRQALEIWGRLASDSPQVPRYRMNLAHRHQNLGLRCHARGEQAGAAEHFQRAAALWTPLVADPPPGKAGSEDQEFAWMTYAWFLANAPEPRWRNPERALELAQKAVSAAPRNADYWMVLGMARFRTEKPVEALAALERAGQLRQDACTDEKFFLALIHRRLDAGAKARLSFEQAVRSMEHGQPGSERLRRLRAEAAAALGLPEPPGRPSERP
jgi:serine/threonine protein kinase/tetratricopeptide (TPR) repeat protein